MGAGVLHDLTAGNDDYALERVPREARSHWFTVATMRFGQISNLAMFLIGATLGFGMTFWDAFLALLIGSLILEAAAIATGVLGQREGLSTSMLARWAGFGRVGSAAMGLAIAVSLVGWFGVQSQVSAQGLRQLLGVLPEWGWSLLFGLTVTAIVMYGIRWMAWTAYLAVPALLLLAGWSIVAELADHSVSDLVSSPPPGPELSLVKGIVLVAGAYIVGTVISPDMTRYNRSAGDVVKQTVVGITLGNFVIGLAGVLLAHAAGTANIVAIVTSTSGVVGPIVIVAAVFKINDWNLYSASLGVVNFFEVVFGRRLDRAMVAAVIGVTGSVVAAVGILDHFQEFLETLGYVFPPIVGIMVAEAYVVKVFAGGLAEGRDEGRLPVAHPVLVPATLVVWIVGAVIGKYVTWGLGPVNALVAGFVLYAVLGRLGWVRAVGLGRAKQPHPVREPHPTRESRLR